MYKYAVDTPVSYQWDEDSRLPLPDPGSAPDNCGPAAVENVGHYYTDEPYGVFRTRRLAAADYGPTTFGQQREMLERRGVPCYITKLSLENLRAIVRGGQRPIIVGMNFAYIPDDIAGHPFNGWHAVEVLDVDGDDHVLIRDPNFNRTYRKDPTNGRRRYPNWVIRAALAHDGCWCIVPFSSKKVVRYARLKGDGVNVRVSKGRTGTTKLGRIFATTRRNRLVKPDGEIVFEPATKRLVFRGYVQGARHGIGAYPKTWARVVIRGHVRYVARPLIERV